MGKMLSKQLFLPGAETLHHYSWLRLYFTAKFGEISLPLSLSSEDSITQIDETFMQHREKVKISLVFQFDQFAYTFDCWLKVGWPSTSDGKTGESRRFENFRNNEKVIF